ncbi:dTMP kinase, partial [Candidatus Parcubacteria bacterium]|nr:dTMP kinase [Candidatus Parcubacteria bacterium]
MIKNKYKGKFIVIEGLDGAGSSTQVIRVANFLKERNKKIHITKEPTNSLIGGLIRGQLTGDWKSSPECLQLLFAADRAHHLDKELIPLLKRGINVISDRYFFSTIAFGSTEIKDKEWLININDRFIIPDLTILVKVSPKICIKRIKGSRFQIELFEKEKKLQKTWENYKKLVEEFDNIKIVNGERKVEEISYEIINLIEKVI